MKIISHRNKWAIGADRLQWIIYVDHPRLTHAVSFVSSDRDILARCLREKGCPPDIAAFLLEGLPSTFKEWRTQNPLEQRRMR